MGQRIDGSKVVAGAGIVVAMFGFVFFGIGVTVLVFLWGADDGFGSPPLFFRVFGSFIALAFLTFGGVMCAGGIMGIRKRKVSLPMPPMPPMALHQAEGRPTTAARYACTRCGAPLGDKVEVSPLGDAKCSFCGSWFNVHGKR